MDCLTFFVFVPSHWDCDRLVAFSRQDDCSTKTKKDPTPMGSFLPYCNMGFLMNSQTYYTLMILLKKIIPLYFLCCNKKHPRQRVFL